jgi:multiple sugar transport system ATP-binding protein
VARLRIRNLSVTIGRHAIIESLDLDVDDGEFLVLLGPSGCGKSTLLNSIAGLSATSSGTIEIGDIDVTLADPVERNIGMVFQAYALYPTMTVERNMSFGLRVRGIAPHTIEERVLRTAKILRLEGLLKRRPAQLSGGQRQRVAIGRALVRDAGLFLFDEPLSNLDAGLRSELRRELKLLHSQLRSTMIYVTHDQVEAMALATRIAVMRDGTVQQVGAPAQVYDEPQNLFVAGFLGAPPMNLVHGVAAGRDGAFAIESRGLSAILRDYPFRRAAPEVGVPVVIGIRPEHVQIAAAAGPVSGVVTLVEPMGSHQVVWVDCAGALLASLQSSTRRISVGETVHLNVEVDRVALFDPATGVRI